MNRNARVEAARQTLAALDSGEYALADGARVSIRDELQACLAGTTLHEPEELAGLVVRLRGHAAPAAAASIDVVNETTLQGIDALLESGVPQVGALNFASARNPGGGFQGGSQAQEESLARSSGLYASLMRAWPYYERHRAASSLLYTDAIIWSPRCPVIRDDAGNLLAAPRLTSFLTCAAPNAGAVEKNQPADVAQIAPTLRRRAEGVLALAASRSLPALVLGAWGCGVFRNDPQVVAGIFRELLLGPAQWARHFTHLRFSVYDASPSPATFRAFEQAFAAAPH